MGPVNPVRGPRKPRPAELVTLRGLAEAILVLTPWKMWDLKTGGIAAGAGTKEAMDLLEPAFTNDPAAWNHPGLLHLYVHLIEMSPFPQRALMAGDRLCEPVPDARHLIHMPTLIDVLCGHYHNVVHSRPTANISIAPGR